MMGENGIKENSAYETSAEIPQFGWHSYQRFFWNGAYSLTM
ncbi:MAG: hypothetical protein OCU22_06480 [Canidatus Methanoxibalbensis ujae]|nr:hypothetical protein [Candidatus Methanoxibalbensis ujae]